MTSNLHHCPDQDRIGQGAWHSLRRAIRAVSFACLCTAIAPLGGRAQGASTGVIAGRVLNPASGEYVRNAQVRVEGTNLSAISEDGGFYRLPGVGPGDVKLVVIYTGYHPATATVHIMPGGTVTRDFELASALQAQPATGGAPITLAVFTVSSEREGNAKAIMQQRNSMDITNSVSSDVFGDVAEGNIGEFLKHMPGVEVDLQQGEARNISLRGLESQYTQVTMDGISLASADALGAGTNDAARAFSVENVSLNSMESIEVSKTVSADVDADAPAGTINLRSKRAFNAAGRRITTQANLTEFSARFNLDDSYGPDDRKSRKIHPGGIFEYSDVLFNKRLGVSLNISESMVYSANARNQITYNYTTTTVPADPRPVVPTQILFLHAPRTNRRSAVTFNADYKATSRLVLSFSLLYNYSRLNNPQRTLRFNTGARDTVVGADPLTSLTTSSPAASVVSSPSGNVKLGQTITAVSRLEYKIGNLTLEGKFAGSNAISWYDPNGRNGEVLDVLSPTLTGLTFTAQRSSLRSADWKIVQTGGPDMADGANYTTTRITSDQGWSNVTDRFSGEITGTLRTTTIVPIVWKAGVKKKFEGRECWRDTDSLRYNLIGAAPLGAWAGYNSPFSYDIGGTNTDASLRSISGGTVFVPDLVRIGTLFR
ncbi:MAG: TonB-dependent receptor plug domain-containing protein, partial [Opitutaceae bacterium]